MGLGHNGEDGKDQSSTSSHCWKLTHRKCAERTKLQTDACQTSVSCLVELDKQLSWNSWQY